MERVSDFNKAFSSVVRSIVGSCISIFHLRYENHRMQNKPNKPRIKAIHSLGFGRS